MPGSEYQRAKTPTGRKRPPRYTPECSQHSQQPAADAHVRYTATRNMPTARRYALSRFQSLVKGGGMGSVRGEEASRFQRRAGAESNEWRTMFHRTLGCGRQVRHRASVPEEPFRQLQVNSA